jgi:hypothetical protein
MKKLGVLAGIVAALAALYLGSSAYIKKLERDIKSIDSAQLRVAQPITEEDVTETEATNLVKIVSYANGIIKAAGKNLEGKTFGIYESIANSWEPGEKEGLRRYIDTHPYLDVILLTKTPVQARKLIQVYEERNNTPCDKFWSYSFKEIHERRIRVKCSEAAMIAAATLSDDCYRPFVLMLSPKEKGAKTHGAFIYKYDGRLGYIDNNFMTGPQFSSVDDMISYMGSVMERQFRNHLIINLEREDPNWITTKDNLNRKKRFGE